MVVGRPDDLGLSAFSIWQGVLYLPLPLEKKHVNDRGYGTPGSILYLGFFFSVKHPPQLENYMSLKTSL